MHITINDNYWYNCCASSMASLLSKFRIDYSALKVIPDISKPAQESTKNFFNLLIENFQQTEDPKATDDGIKTLTLSG